MNLANKINGTISGIVGSIAIAVTPFYGGSCVDEINDLNTSCGNSPFVGKYLWLISGDCDVGMIKPFDEETCTGELHHFDSSTEVTANGGLIATNYGAQRLTRILSGHQNSNAFNNCVLNFDSSIYMTVDGRDVWKLMPEKWPGTVACNNLSMTKKLYNHCKQYLKY
jgi:hypothetical protein